MRERSSKRGRRGRGKADKPIATRKPTCLELDAILEQVRSFLPPQLTRQYSRAATNPRLGQHQRRNSHNATINTVNINSHGNN